MDPLIARQTWRTLEPIHGLIYFAPEAAAAYAAIGVEGRPGYFASRAAPMGAVPAEVIIATFFNFHPGLVRHAMHEVWDRVTPAAVSEARLVAADAALRRLLGAGIDSDDLVAAATLARRAAHAATDDVAGRPLFAGHATLEWPAEPHLVLWHAQTLLREYRGDGHVAALVAEGLSGIDALVLHAATNEVPRAALQTTRAWSDEEWNGAVARLAQRGLVHDDATFTDAGRSQRAAIEQRTDELARAPYAVLGEGRCAELRRAARPLSRRIAESGALAMAPNDPAAKDSS